MDNLHHANLLVGTVKEAESYLEEICKSLGVSTLGNPDFHAFRAKTFGIDEARELGVLSSRKTLVGGGKKFFLISPERLTLEAQNALLKTFEDPSPDTHFFLVVREEGMLLPTLLSRMSVIRFSGDSLISGEADNFLALSLKDRLIFVKKFVDEEKSLPSFLDRMLFILRDRHGSKEALRSVYNVRRFADDISSSPRIILEHLSLVL